MFSRRSVVFAAGLLAAGLFGAGCSDTKECTLVACESFALVRMRAAVSPADIASATISACRGEGATQGCSTGRIPIVPSAPGDRLEFSMAGAVNAKGFVTTPDPAKGFLLEVSFNLEGVTTKEGDTYEVKVLVNNAPIAQFSERASYQLTQPNGPECPPVCKTTVLDKS